MSENQKGVQYSINGTDVRIAKKVHSINGKDVSNPKRYILKMGQIWVKKKKVHSINETDVSNPNSLLKNGTNVR